MGRQINFYMLLEDEEEFIKVVKDVNGIVIQDKLKDRHPLIINKIPKNIDLRWDIYICRKDFLDHLFYNTIKAKNGREIYYLDGTKSFVIEFTPSNLINNGLTWGRIWAEFKYWDKDEKGDNIIVEKPKEFTRWYQKLERWIRKNYVKRGSSYYSKRVLEWEKRGGKVKINW